MVQGQRDVDQRDHDHRDRQPLLQPHDRVEAEDAGGHDHGGDDQERDHLGEVAVAPAEPPEDGRGGEGRERDQHGLPAHEQQVGHRRRGAALPNRPNAARDSTSVGRRPALAGDRDQPDEQEGQHRADHRGHQRLREAQPEAEHEGAVGDREDRDVRGAPRPEQLGRGALALGLVDDVDAVGLDPEAGRGDGRFGDAHGRCPPGTTGGVPAGPPAAPSSPSAPTRARVTPGTLPVYRARLLSSISSGAKQIPWRTPWSRHRPPPTTSPSDSGRWAGRARTPSATPPGSRSTRSSRCTGSRSAAPTASPSTTTTWSRSARPPASATSRSPASRRRSPRPA